MNHQTINQVEDYIEEVLIQSTTFVLEESETITFGLNQGPKIKIFQEKVKNKDDVIIHLIMA